MKAPTAAELPLLRGTLITLRTKCRDCGKRRQCAFCKSCGDPICEPCQAPLVNAAMFCYDCQQRPRPQP